MAGAHYYVLGVADPGKGTGGTMFFSMEELRGVVDSKSAEGVRVWLEHGDATKEDIGTVLHTSLDAETGMHIVMAFDRSSLRSRVVCEWIRSGLFSGISLGYNAELDARMDVKYKRITEVSIVNKPHHPTCWVYDVCDTLPPELHATIFCAAPAPLPMPVLDMPLPVLDMLLPELDMFRSIPPRTAVACAAAATHGAALQQCEEARGAAFDAHVCGSLVFATLAGNAV